MEAWSNLGRILGLGFASTINFVNALVAAGAGSRYLRSVGKNITGNVIKDIVIKAALNPRKALELAKTSATQLDTFTEVAVRGLIDSLNVPGAIFQAGRKRPGVALEVFTEPVEDVEDVDEAVPGPQTSVFPAQPRSRRAATTPIGSPIGSSILSQTNVLGPPPPAQGQIDPQRLAQLRDVGLPLFANKGGIVSIKRKPRQLVG